MDCPRVVIAEPYSGIETEEASRGFLVVQALAENDAFRAEAENLMQRFPWLKQTWPWQEMAAYANTKAGIGNPTWPDDWREGIKAVQSLAERWLGQWPMGVEVVGLAVESVAAGCAFGPVRAYSVPEGKRIRLVLDIAYYDWGWDTLRRVILNAVLAEARQQYKIQKPRGRQADDLTFLRDVRLYLWRVQGLGYKEIVERWRCWYKAYRKRVEERWGGLSEVKRMELAARWDALAELNEEMARVGVSRAKRTLKN